MEHSQATTRAFATARMLIGSALLLAAAGCGSEAFDQASGYGESAASDSEAFTGWTNLTMANGWQVFDASNPPAVKVINSTFIVFRGAVKAPSNVTNDSPFTLPTGFRTTNPDICSMRVAMANPYGGTLFVDEVGAAHIQEDGATPPGTHAKQFTSLEGLSFDITSAGAEEIEYLNGTSGLYPFRDQGAERGATGKLVNGMVRLQGMVTGTVFPNPSLQLPADLTPGQNVWTPISLCPGINGGFADLLITNSGTVWVEATSPADPGCEASLEGVVYALSATSTSLPLGPGWKAFNPRPVKVRNDNGIIRLQGSVMSGTSTTVATLPSNMKPPTTVYVAATANNHTRARLRIESGGNIVVETPSLSTASKFLSLDSVSFAL